MLLIPCPWCGPRDELEFSYGGETGIVRPGDPAALSDEQWGTYLYIRNNVRGSHSEQWCHAAGCRRWFNMSRDTLTNQIEAVYRIGAQAPGGDSDAG